MITAAARKPDGRRLVGAPRRSARCLADRRRVALAAETAGGLIAAIVGLLVVLAAAIGFPAG